MAAANQLTPAFSVKRGFTLNPKTWARFLDILSFEGPPEVIEGTRKAAFLAFGENYEAILSEARQNLGKEPTLYANVTKALNLLGARSLHRFLADVFEGEFSTAVCPMPDIAGRCLLAQSVKYVTETSDLNLNDWAFYYGDGVIENQHASKAMSDYVASPPEPTDDAEKYLQRIIARAGYDVMVAMSVWQILDIAGNDAGKQAVLANLGWIPWAGMNN